MAEKDFITFDEASKSISCQWQILIKDILDLKLDESIESPQFNFCGEFWYLQIYRQKGHKISVYLERQESELTCHVLNNVSLKFGEKLQRESKELLFDKEVDCGLIASMPKSELLQYSKSVDEEPSCSMEILAKFNLFNCEVDQGTEARQTSQTLTSEFEGLSKSLENAFLEQDLSDVMIQVGQKKFPSHKFILAARSPVFSSMFKHEMSENISGVIEIEDCDPVDFENFLKFLYTGRVALVTSANALNIYKIAHKYELKELQVECTDRLCKSFTTENICDILDMSVTHEEKELLDKATEFFIKNCSDVFNTENWLKFLTEKPALANELLKQMSAYYGLNRTK